MCELGVAFNDDPFAFSRAALFVGHFTRRNKSPQQWGLLFVRVAEKRSFPNTRFNCYTSTSNLMADKILIPLSHVLEVAFFLGLVGCVFMIIFSWIDIFAECFTKDDD
jgi:hypothetical protein